MNVEKQNKYLELTKQRKQLVKKIQTLWDLKNVSIENYIAHKSEYDRLSKELNKIEQKIRKAI